MEFLKININPKNKKTTDCAVRAVAQACNIAYNEAAKELFDLWLETGYEMTEPRTMTQVLEKHGFVTKGKPKHENKHIIPALSAAVLASTYIDTY